MQPVDTAIVQVDTAIGPEAEPYQVYEKRNEIKRLFVKTFFAVNEIKAEDLTPAFFSKIRLNERFDPKSGVLSWWLTIEGKEGV